MNKLQPQKLHQKSEWLYKSILLVISCILMLCITGCGKNVQVYSKVDTGMGTIINQKLYLKGCTTQDEAEIAGSIMDIVEDLEKNVLSWRLPSSEIYQINEKAGNEAIKMSSELETMINTILDVSRESQGALDITIGDTVQLWNIDAYLNGEVNEFQPPSEEAIKESLKDAGYEKIKIDQDKISLPENMKLDMGALGKGIACDKIYEYLSKQDKVKGATISVGGSILTYGKKTNGEKWNVAIINPSDASSSIGYFALEGKWCISTSGSYERVINQDDNVYHHILDPFTGYPADCGITSVSILCESGILSDALSTACFVLGVEKGLLLAEEFNAHAVIVDKSGQIYTTKGIEKYFITAI